MEDEDAGRVKINLTILDEKDFRDEPPVEKPKRRTMNKPSGRPKKKKEKEPVVEEDEEPEIVYVKKKKQVVVEESESEGEEAEEEVKEGDLSWIWYVVPLGLMILKAITTQ